MKIALVILHADPARGGAERYTIDLAAALARRGHDVRVIATSFSDDIEEKRRVLVPVTAFTRSGRYRQFLNLLDQYLAPEKYDIVHAMLPVRHCHVYHPHAGMAAEALGKRNRFLNPRRMTMARVENDLLNGSRFPLVISLSDYVKRSILKHYPQLGDRLTTLFNAVDLDRFQPCARANREMINALFIGQDFERKGLMQAVDAMRMVNDPRLRLTVVGKDRSNHSLSAADVIKVGGTSDTRPYYTAADFFVLPTKHDPCSLVVLEALAMGLPVISTKFNGACEIMTDGVHGYVLDDPTDVKALAEAMRKMLDPAQRAEMSRACLELRPTLSYEHHLDQLEAIYRKTQSAKS